jgi:hypothetical protein
MTELTPVTGAIIVAALTVAGSIVGAAFVYRSTTRDQRARHRIDSTKQFLELAAVAQGLRHENDANKVGLTEQVAAVTLLASFGVSIDELHPAAKAALVQVMDIYRPPLRRDRYAMPTDEERIYEAAKEALRRL